MSTYKAHIFKERNVGEREEVKLKIFGPDGSPLDLVGGGGGGSPAAETVAYQGWVSKNTVPGDDQAFTLVPFGEQNDYVSGIDAPDGEEFIEVPAGMYVAKINPNWNWPLAPSPPPDLPGVAIVQLIFTNSQTEGNIVDFTMNSVYDGINGMGDSNFIWGGVTYKMGLAALSEPSEIRCRVLQTGSLGPEGMNFSATVAFAKL